MKSRAVPLQLISGLAALTGLLVLGWATVGQPAVSWDRIGSGLQAIGAAVELWAICILIKPWAAPNLTALCRAIVGLVKRVRRYLRSLWPFTQPQRPTPVDIDLSPAGGTSSATLKLETGEPTPATMEERVASAEGKIKAMDRAIVDLGGEVSDVRREMRSGLEVAHRSLQHQLADTEAQQIRVRVADGLRLLLGVFLSLVGATISALS